MLVVSSSVWWITLFSLEFLQSTSKQHTCCECTKLCIYCKFKVQKIQINTNLCCHTGLCLLKVLLNLNSMYKYIAVVQQHLFKLYRVKGKNTINIRAYYWKQMCMNHLFLVDTKILMSIQLSYFNWLHKQICHIICNYILHWICK